MGQRATAQNAYYEMKRGKYRVVFHMLDNGLNPFEEFYENPYDTPTLFYKYFIKDGNTYNEHYVDIVRKIFRSTKQAIEPDIILTALEKTRYQIPVTDIIYHLENYKSYTDVEFVLKKLIKHDLEQYTDFELEEIFRLFAAKKFKLSDDDWEVILGTHWGDDFVRFMDALVKYNISFPSDPDFIGLLFQHEAGERYLDYVLMHGGEIPDLNSSFLSEEEKNILANYDRQYNPNKFHYLPSDKQEQIESLYMLRGVASTVVNKLPRELLNIIADYLVTTS